MTPAGVLTGLNALTDQTIEYILHNWKKTQWEGERDNDTQKWERETEGDRQAENTERPRCDEKDSKWSKEAQNVS